MVFAAAISKHQDRAAAAVPAKCSTSVQGAILRSQAYKTLASENMQDCYHLCRAEHRCQSINFYQKQKICEFNNRTASPSNRLKIVNNEILFFENPFRGELGEIS